MKEIEKHLEKYLEETVYSSPIAKILVFRVIHHVQPDIDLLESSIDGTSILCLLGFIPKEFKVNLADEIRTEIGLAVPEEKFSLMMKNYEMD